nr:hypothetical protein [Tanacetum cinerariifolium]
MVVRACVSEQQGVVGSRVNGGKKGFRGGGKYCALHSILNVRTGKVVLLDITIEEYTRLEEEKARKREKVLNWKTAKYGKIWYDEDIHDLSFVETHFPATAFIDGVSSEKQLLVNRRLSCGIKSQAGSESRPPMRNKENYVPWSSRLLRYAKSRPNGKLILNFILNGPYVRRMIPEPGDVNVTETFHEQTNDELSKKELKQIEADDQAIQTILLGLPEDIYAAVDSCETAQEIWLRVQQMMKGPDIRIQEKKAKLFNEWERFTSYEGESIESYYHHFLKLMNDLKRNKHFPEKIASNLKFLNNLQREWSRHVTIVHQTKDLHTADYTQLYDFLKYNQKEVDELKAERLAKIQDPLALMTNSNNPYASPMVRGNGGNQFRQYAGQNAGNLNGYNAVQNDGNQNQIGNGNLVAVRAKGNTAGHNGNQI